MKNNLVYLVKCHKLYHIVQGERELKIFKITEPNTQQGKAVRGGEGKPGNDVQKQTKTKTNVHIIYEHFKSIKQF